MTTMLIPVGHDLGVLYPEAGSTVRFQQVRAGGEVAELGDADFAVWLLAHGTDARDRPGRESVAAAADQLGLPRGQAELAVERFLADGLLVEVEPESESAVRFAESHQLIPLLTGLGTDPEQGWLQTIGVIGQPVVQVSTPLYDVWTWAQLAPHLWAGCHDAATVAQQIGVTDPEQTEPRRMLTGVLRNVHALLGVRAAYFDRRRPR